MPTVNQSEAAHLLGIFRRTVRRRIEAGELPSGDTPDGPTVVLEAESAPIPDNGLSAETHNDDLAARLERAEDRIDRLLGVVDDQNRTIHAQTIRLAQLEHRIIDAAPAKTPE